MGRASFRRLLCQAAPADKAGRRGLHGCERSLGQKHPPGGSDYSVLTGLDGAKMARTPTAKKLIQLSREEP